MNWTAKINETLDELGLYPDVEAFDIQDAADHIVMVDTQETTVYTSSEGVYRWLKTVHYNDNLDVTFERVFQAIQPNLVEGIDVVEEDGVWHVDHAQPGDEE